MAFHSNIEVLMEPKWNVKKHYNRETINTLSSINGTKVECKVTFGLSSLIVGASINGTKVECKVISVIKQIVMIPVLMEPKWNVKKFNLIPGAIFTLY